VKCGKNVFRYSPFVLLYDFLILLYIVFLRIIKCRREYITEDGTATSYSRHHKKSGILPIFVKRSIRILR